MMEGKGPAKLKKLASTHLILLKCHVAPLVTLRNSLASMTPPPGQAIFTETKLCESMNILQGQYPLSSRPNFFKFAEDYPSLLWPL